VNKLLVDHRNIFDAGGEIDSITGFATPLDVRVEHPFEPLYPGHLEGETRSWSKGMACAMPRAPRGVWPSEDSGYLPPHRQRHQRPYLLQEQIHTP